MPFAPKVIVDAGANIGMASIYFARRYPEARIISIEAEPSNFRMLEKNVHSYPQITPVHAALWNQSGEISVGSPEGNTAETAFVTSETITGQRVRAATVPTIMREFGVEEIDLLKVDIEGAEKEVFECCDWASKVRCLMVETHDRLRPGSSCAVDSAMRDFIRSQRGETTFYLSNGPKRANVGPARSHD